MPDDISMEAHQAALWHLGQAGYLVHSCGVMLAIDPYLSDSVGRTSPEYSRAIPVPIAPEELKVDLFLVTHDHLDHLDPETIGPYRHKKDTLFIAPRLACRKLKALGVPEENIIRVDSGEEQTLMGVRVQGIYAVPSAPEVMDTTGYRLEFRNGRSLYHTSDTDFSEMLLKAAPQAEVLLVCINGKWGNLDPDKAAKLAAAVRPRVAVPNHYDMMRLNSEDPAAFARLARETAPDVHVTILNILEPLIW